MIRRRNLGLFLAIFVVASVNGRGLVSERHLLSHGGQYVPLERQVLSPGNHQVEVELSGSDLHPGSRGRPQPLGPLALATATADLPVTYVAASQADSLCGRRLDWVEAVSGGPRRPGNQNVHGNERKMRQPSLVGLRVR